MKGVFADGVSPKLVELCREFAYDTVSVPISGQDPVQQVGENQKNSKYLNENGIVMLAEYNTPADFTTYNSATVANDIKQCAMAIQVAVKSGCRGFIFNVEPHVPEYGDRQQSLNSYCDILRRIVGQIEVRHFFVTNYGDFSAAEIYGCMGNHFRTPRFGLLVDPFKDLYADNGSIVGQAGWTKQCNGILISSSVVVEGGNKAKKVAKEDFDKVLQDMRVYKGVIFVKQDNKKNFEKVSTQINEKVC